MPHRHELAVFLAVAGFTYLSVSRDLSDPNHGNVWSRLGLMFSIVERGALDIDPYVRETPDWSHYENHYYSNKAPGPAVMAAPFYFIQYRIEKAFDIPSDSARARNVAQYVANLVTSIAPTLVALALLWLVLLRRFALAPLAAFALCGAWATGSLALVYSVLFFGHQTAAAFFCIGMCLTLLDDDPGERRIFWAGLAMGAAVASDYVVAQFVLVWTGWLAWRTHHDQRRLAAWALGGAVPALLLLLYNKACFGSIFTSAYSSAVINPQWAPLNTMDAPSLDRLADITVRPFRGILYCTPVYALVLIGIERLRDTARERPALIAAAVAVVAHFIYLSALPSAFGGFCIGPRYATSLLPLATLLLIPAVRLVPRLFGVLVALGTVLMLVAALTDPLPHQAIRDPFHEYLFPLLETNGHTAEMNVFSSLLDFTLPQALAAYLVVWGITWAWLWRRLRVRV